MSIQIKRYTLYAKMTYCQNQSMEDINSPHVLSTL